MSSITLFFASPPSNTQWPVSLITCSPGVSLIGTGAALSTLYWLAPSWTSLPILDSAGRPTFTGFRDILITLSMTNPTALPNLVLPAIQPTHHSPPSASTPLSRSSPPTAPLTSTPGLFSCPLNPSFYPTACTHLLTGYAPLRLLNCLTVLTGGCTLNVAPRFTFHLSSSLLAQLLASHDPPYSDCLTGDYLGPLPHRPTTPIRFSCLLNSA